MKEETKLIFFTDFENKTGFVRLQKNLIWIAFGQKKRRSLNCFCLHRKVLLKRSHLISLVAFPRRQLAMVCLCP